MPESPPIARHNGWVGYAVPMRRFGVLLCGVAAAGCGSSALPDAGGDASVRPDAAELVVDAGAGGDADQASDCMPIETAVVNEGWSHVPEGTGLSSPANPPASGPHYPIWARYSIHTHPVARGYWLHNVEHGAVVLLYRSDAAPALVNALSDAWTAIPNDPACGHRRALLTADAQLEVPIAVVAADVVMKSECVSRAAILAFVAAHRNQGPEKVCADGSVGTGPPQSQGF